MSALKTAPVRIVRWGSKYGFPYITLRAGYDDINVLLEQEQLDRILAFCRDGERGLKSFDINNHYEDPVLKEKKPWPQQK